MLQRLRTLLGFGLMAMGTLGTMAAPVQAGRGTGGCSNGPARHRPPPLGSASRPRRSSVAEPREPALGAAGGDASGGLRRVVESRMQHLVAEQLGVEPAELVPEVSLTDDLAADSLDLLELALVVEAHFAVALPASRLDQIRTYGDLLDVVMGSFDGRQLRERVPSDVPMKVRVLSGHDRSVGVERVGMLTPYAMETITEDAMRAGRGARLEVTIPAGIEDMELASIRHDFARLGRRGVQVMVHRDGDMAALWPGTGNAG